VTTSERVIALTDADLVWSFREPLPTVNLNRHGGYQRAVRVDPCPAYPHDPALVAEQLERVEAAFPIGAPPTIYLLPREEVGRSNGYESGDIVGGHDGTPKRLATHICFSAKRIPIHPAMTRYLVAHEYGHAVEDWLLWRRAKQTHEHDVVDEYARLRGIAEPQHEASAGSWHSAIGEIFACDFRILVAQVETEFWPHPGIERPEGIRAIRDWWAGRLAEDTYRELPNAA
jgi:hypothetical protein